MDTVLYSPEKVTRTRMNSSIKNLNLFSQFDKGNLQNQYKTSQKSNNKFGLTKKRFFSINDFYGSNRSKKSYEAYDVMDLKDIFKRELSNSKMQSLNCKIPNNVEDKDFNNVNESSISLISCIDNKPEAKDYYYYSIGNNFKLNYSDDSIYYATNSLKNDFLDFDIADLCKIKSDLSSCFDDKLEFGSHRKIPEINPRISSINNKKTLNNNPNSNFNFFNLEDGLDSNRNGLKDKNFTNYQENNLLKSEEFRKSNYLQSQFNIYKKFIDSINLNNKNNNFAYPPHEYNKSSHNYQWKDNFLEEIKIHDNISDRVQDKNREVIKNSKNQEINFNKEKILNEVNNMINDVKFQVNDPQYNNNMYNQNLNNQNFQIINNVENIQNNYNSNSNNYEQSAKKGDLNNFNNKLDLNYNNNFHTTIKFETPKNNLRKSNKKLHEIIENSREEKSIGHSAAFHIKGSNEIEIKVNPDGSQSDENKKQSPTMNNHQNDILKNNIIDPLITHKVSIGISNTNSNFIKEINDNQFYKKNSVGFYENSNKNPEYTLKNNTNNELNNFNKFQNNDKFAENYKTETDTNKFEPNRKTTDYLADDNKIKILNNIETKKEEFNLNNPFNFQQNHFINLKTNEKNFDNNLITTNYNSNNNNQILKSNVTNACSNNNNFNPKINNINIKTYPDAYKNTPAIIQNEEKIKNKKDYPPNSNNYYYINSKMENNINTKNTNFGDNKNTYVYHYKELVAPLVKEVKSADILESSNNKKEIKILQETKFKSDTKDLKNEHLGMHNKNSNDFKILQSYYDNKDAYISNFPIVTNIQESNKSDNVFISNNPVNSNLKIESANNFISSQKEYTTNIDKINANIINTNNFVSFNELENIKLKNSEKMVVSNIISTDGFINNNNKNLNLKNTNNNNINSNLVSSNVKSIVISTQNLSDNNGIKTNNFNDLYQNLIQNQVSSQVEQINPYDLKDQNLKTIKNKDSVYSSINSNPVIDTYNIQNVNSINKNDNIKYEDLKNSKITSNYYNNNFLKDQKKEPENKEEIYYIKTQENDKNEREKIKLDTLCYTDYRNFKRDTLDSAKNSNTIEYVYTEERRYPHNNMNIENSNNIFSSVNSLDKNNKNLLSKKSDEIINSWENGLIKNTGQIVNQVNQENSYFPNPTKNGNLIKSNTFQKPPIYSNKYISTNPNNRESISYSVKSDVPYVNSNSCQNKDLSKNPDSTSNTFNRFIINKSNNEAFCEDKKNDLKDNITHFSNNSKSEKIIKNNNMIETKSETLNFFNCENNFNNFDNNNRAFNIENNNPYNVSPLNKNISSIVFNSNLPIQDVKINDNHCYNKYLDGVYFDDPRKVYANPSQEVKKTEDFGIQNNNIASAQLINQASSANDFINYYQKSKSENKDNYIINAVPNNNDELRNFKTIDTQRVIQTTHQPLNNFNFYDQSPINPVVNNNNGFYTSKSQGQRLNQNPINFQYKENINYTDNQENIKITEKNPNINNIHYFSRNIIDNKPEKSSNYTNNDNKHSFPTNYEIIYRDNRSVEKINTNNPQLKTISSENNNNNIIYIKPISEPDLKKIKKEIDFYKPEYLYENNVLQNKDNLNYMTFNGNSDTLNNVPNTISENKPHNPLFVANSKVTSNLGQNIYKYITSNSNNNYNDKNINPMMIGKNDNNLNNQNNYGYSIGKKDLIENNYQSKNNIITMSNNNSDNNYKTIDYTYENNFANVKSGNIPQKYIYKTISEPKINNNQKQRVEYKKENINNNFNKLLIHEDNINYQPSQNTQYNRHNTYNIGETNRMGYDLITIDTSNPTNVMSIQDNYKGINTKSKTPILKNPYDEFLTKTPNNYFENQKISENNNRASIEANDFEKKIIFDKILTTTNKPDNYIHNNNQFKSITPQLKYTGKIDSNELQEVNKNFNFVEKNNNKDKSNDIKIITENNLDSFKHDLKIYEYSTKSANHNYNLNTQSNKFNDKQTLDKKFSDNNNSNLDKKSLSNNQNYLEGKNNFGINVNDNFKMTTNQALLNTEIKYNNNNNFKTIYAEKDSLNKNEYKNTNIILDNNKKSMYNSNNFQNKNSSTKANYDGDSNKNNNTDKKNTYYNMNRINYKNTNNNNIKKNEYVSLNKRIGASSNNYTNQNSYNFTEANENNIINKNSINTGYYNNIQVSTHGVIYNNNDIKRYTHNINKK